MIRLISDMRELDHALGSAPDIFTERIRTLALAYGFGYPFCRFWVQDGGAVISGYYDSGTVTAPGGIGEEQAGELAEFLSCGQFTRLTMPYPLCEKLGMCGTAQRTNVMVYPDGIKYCDEINKELPRTDVSLEQVYEIAKSGFDIDYDKWYTDTSHILRHGIAGVYVLDRCSCAVRMFSSRGISYLSYVCTLPEARGRGLAARLVQYICAAEHERGNRTFVVCTDELRGFYERAGFVPDSFAADIVYL